MLFATTHRFHPRSGRNIEDARREAALRAQVIDLSLRLAAIEKEQHIQLRRIAEIQVQLDEIQRLLKKRGRRP